MFYRCVLWALAGVLALVCALGTSPDAAARVFGEDDRKALSAAKDPLSRAVILIMPTLDGRLVNRRYVTGVFATNCQTVATVAHLKQLAPDWRSGRSGVALFFRDRRGVWIRRNVPAKGLPNLRRGVGVTSDFMVLRLDAPIPDCQPLTFSVAAPASSTCDRLGLLSMQTPIGGAHARPTLATRCQARPWRGDPAVVAHDCDLSVGASGGALVCLRRGAATALALQVARISARAGIAAVAPSSYARSAPNIAIRPMAGSAFAKALGAVPVAPK